MPLVLLWICFQLLGCLRRNLISEHTKGPSGMQCLNVDSGGSLEIVQPVGGLRDGASNYQNNAITPDHDFMFWVREQLSAAITLLLRLRWTSWLPDTPTGVLCEHDTPFSQPTIDYLASIALAYLP